MRKYIYEFIGTFFLVLTIGCVVLGGAPLVVAALAIGGVLMAMVYTCGHASGAHLNPGVTLAVWIRGKCSTADIVPYMIAQIAAAAAAAMVASHHLFGHTLSTTTPMVISSIPHAFLGEFLFSFALCFLVLNVATSKAHPGNSFYGFAIGIVVLAGACAVGSISGGAFNTAVAVGLGMMKIVAWNQLWIHIVANLSAGVMAGLAFKALNPDDK